ncbi:MAG: spore coat protein U domain-containing protein [Syntrophales bacterium]|nr:spore coat protein U domain-containing protein [Syntrophales bacterium]
MKNLRILAIGLLILPGIIAIAGTAHAATTLTPSSGAISPNATVGVAYTSTTMLVASGGKVNRGKPYTWTSSGLPSGLALTTSGNTQENCIITGTPTVSGTLSFTVTVKDRNNVSATGSYTITILATISCSFIGGSTGAIAFGGIDPTSPSVVLGTVTTPVQFTCTPAGTAYTISANPASGWQLTSGSNALSYTLGVASSGTYAGTAVNVFPANSSSISQGQFVNATAGSYANASTVNVTIAYPGGSIVASLPIGSVTAAVQNACAVTGGSSVSFGDADAVAHAGGKTASATPPTIRCTMGSTVNVTRDNGLNYSGSLRMKDSASNYINYNLSFTTPLTGAGGVSDVGSSLNLGAAMPAGALDNAPAGMYSDTVTLTISY